MKLIDPTDDALNEAFALTVAGWKFTPIENPTKPGARWWSDDKGNLVDAFCDPDANIFTTSADAVLPWLEKWGIWTSERQLRNAGVMVELWTEFPGIGPEYGCPEPPHIDVLTSGYDKTSFPRACVLALLRAHGVEIEFTK